MERSHRGRESSPAPVMDSARFSFDIFGREIASSAAILVREHDEFTCSLSMLTDTGFPDP